jgi:hypothetical protein
MSQNKIIILQWVPGHCDITWNEKVDVLAKKVTLIPPVTYRPIPHHSVTTAIRRSFKVISAQGLAKRTSQILERLNCQHSRLAKELGRCKLSSDFCVWLPCETFVSQRIFFPSFLHTVINEKRVTCTNGRETLLYFQHLTAKDTIRQWGQMPEWRCQHTLHLNKWIDN